MSCVVSSIFRDMAAKSRLSEAFRRLLAAISEAKNLQKPLKNLGFLKVFGKRRFRSLESFRALLELVFGPFLGLLWPLWGPLVALFGVLRALRGLCLGSFSVSFGALVAFGVRVLRDVVDFSCHGGQVEAFRGVLEAVGGHSGGQKPSKTIENLGFL